MNERSKQDVMAEQIWAVLVAAARDGITNLNVIAHAAAGNTLAALETAVESEPWGPGR